MTFNIEEFQKRYTERAEAVKSRPMPPIGGDERLAFCLLYTSPSPRDVEESRMPSSA